MSQEFQFERRLTHSNPPEYHYEYLIKFQDGREGYCRADVEAVWKPYLTEAQRKRFWAMGIQGKDMCITLDDFHPHGKGLNPNKSGFMRKGIGTKMLVMIIDSLKEHNAKFIYCVASTPSMISFVKKQGWTPCDRRKTKWYKLVD